MRTSCDDLKKGRNGNHWSGQTALQLTNMTLSLEPPWPHPLHASTHTRENGWLHRQGNRRYTRYHRPPPPARIGRASGKLIPAPRPDIPTKVIQMHLLPMKMTHQRRKSDVPLATARERLQHPLQNPPTPSRPLGIYNSPWRHASIRKILEALHSEVGQQT